MSIPFLLFQSVVADVEKSWVCLMYQLLSHLRSDLQLPKCLKVVGYLRRMQLFSEPELRLKFLQARDSFFQSILQAIPTQDGTYYSYLSLFDLTESLDRMILFITVYGLEGLEVVCLQKEIFQFCPRASPLSVYYTHNPLNGKKDKPNILLLFGNPAIFSF